MSGPLDMSQGTDSYCAFTPPPLLADYGSRTDWSRGRSAIGVLCGCLLRIWALVSRASKVLTRFAEINDINC